MFLLFCLLHRFAAINAGLLYIYFSSFQAIDEEEYGGVWELTKEGFMTSFAGFLVKLHDLNIFKNKMLNNLTYFYDPFFQVTWTIVYSGLHH